MPPPVAVAFGRRAVAAVAEAHRAAATAVATASATAAVPPTGRVWPAPRTIAATVRGVPGRGLGAVVAGEHRHASAGGAAAARGSNGGGGSSRNGIGGVGGSGDDGGGGAASAPGGLPHPPSAPTASASPPHVPPRPASLDPAEVVKFNAQAAHWWDPDGGPSAALHALNPLRIAYIRAAAEVYGGAGRREGGAGANAATGVPAAPPHPAGSAAAAAADAGVATAVPPHPAGLAAAPSAAAAADAADAATPVSGGRLTGTPSSPLSIPHPPRRPLAGVTALDVGCAGGLVAEPLARLGASVCGIDVSADGVAAAAAHAVAVDGPAALSAGRLTYRVAGVESLHASAAYDLVTCMEVVEHVAAPRDFVGALARRVAPGGVLVLSTLNRTAAAWALGVVAAERVLGWVPPGTHDWGRFVKPGELVAALADVAPTLRVVDVCGLSYRPLSRRFVLSDDVSINYMLTAVRPAGGMGKGVHARG